MANPARKLAFIIASTDHGTFIVNRYDQHRLGPDQAYGVGFQLLEKASHDASEVDMVMRLLDLRRHYHGNGVVAVDCGANLGVHAIDWAKRMTGWGTVIAIEAQERIYYALAGNVAINNVFNARAIHAAVSNQVGTMKMPEPDYLVAGGSCAISNSKSETKRNSSGKTSITRKIRWSTLIHCHPQFTQLGPSRSDKNGC